uniref:Peptidase S1 domain-containing protein n=1 Tax=Globodera rostochiensis TaxID=31243 RepID=A0A914HEY6_GLORO
MPLFNCFLLTFAFGVHLSNGANGPQQKMDEFKLLNSYLPRVGISASKNCPRFILCYNRALFGENVEKLPWKVAGRFHLKNMFSGQSNECAKNAKKIEFLFTDGKVIVGNESFSIKNDTDEWHLKFDLHQICDKILMIDGAEKEPLEFGKEIFGQLKFGPFLNDYAGLWLLGVDLLPRFDQKPTEITLRAPAECELRAFKQQQPNCVTFDDKNAHRLPGGGPINALISGGHQIDIAIMPWTVSFLGISINDTESPYYACSGSLISPEFVLLAAHCFTEQPEGNIFLLGFNSSQDFSVDDYNGIIKEYNRQYNFNRKIFEAGVPLLRDGGIRLKAVKELVRFRRGIVVEHYRPTMAQILFKLACFRAELAMIKQTQAGNNCLINFLPKASIMNTLGWMLIGLRKLQA